MTGRRISTKRERLKVLAELTEAEVRVVRDDRMRIADDLYRVLDSTLDPVALRTAVFTHMSVLIAEAMDESIDRGRASLRDIAERAERAESVAAQTREEAARWTSLTTPDAPSATAPEPST